MPDYKKNEFVEENLDPQDWDEVRKTAHHMLDDMVDYLQTVGDRPPWKHAPESVKTNLNQPLPLEPEQIEQIPAILSQLCNTMGILSGDTIITLLKNPWTELDIIKKVKAYSKEISSGIKGQPDYEVAAAIYYGAIASALLFHNKKITTHSYEKLVTSFKRMIEKSWISTDLKIFDMSGVA